MILDLPGFIALLAVALASLAFMVRLPFIAIPLLVAFCARAGASLFNLYVAPLPDSGADAIAFERVAWDWAQGGLMEVIGIFTGPDSFFISWVIAMCYSVTDRSPLLAQSISTLFGMGTVMLGWVLTRELWGDRAAKKAIWVLALFPTLVLYSSLVMREAYIWFFLLVGLLGVVYWARGRTLLGILLGLVGFAGATMFHGAMLLGLLGFSALIAWRAGGNFVLRALRGYLRGGAFGMFLVVVIAGGSYVTGAYSVPKLGTIDQLLDTERVLSRMARSSRDTASYPGWLVPDSMAGMVALSPIRTAYFMFAPFPWDVRNTRHIIGMLDGFLYLLLFFFMLRNWREIWENREARSVMLVMIPLVAIFALAIGNFGTGIRHRAKFVAVLISLATPALPRLVFVPSDSRASFRIFNRTSR